MKKGTVYLVGAGPGDPGLLTIKGKKCLQQADVVIYDRLINNTILSYADSRAELIYVGKSATGDSFTQDRTNELLAHHARDEKIVVRLKGGDPFLFGRGGEEALYLRERGLNFEVVPGVSSAFAVPAYAGIPVTHRDMASSLSVITGHENPDKKISSLHWPELSGGAGTLVFLMGVKNLSYIVKQLLENGKPPNTPAALIRYGTTHEQEFIAGTLLTIVNKADEAGVQPPAVFIVGDVVSLREKLAWFEKKPLWGKTVVVTRPEAQSPLFVEKIVELGGNPVEFPTIEIRKNKDLTPLQHAFLSMGQFNWVIFTSLNAVDIFFDELYSHAKDARIFCNSKVCAIGPKTALRLKQKGIVPDMVPDQYCAEGIISVLKNAVQPGEKVLLPRAGGARMLLPEDIKSLGAVVEEINLYEAVVPDRVDENALNKILSGEADFITFTSSSTVNNFIHLVGEKYTDRFDSKTKVACIGPITADTARKNGFRVDIVAETYTTEGLLEAMVEDTLKNVQFTNMQSQ